MSLKLKLLEPNRLDPCRDLEVKRSRLHPHAGGNGGGCIAARGEDSILESLESLSSQLTVQLTVVVELRELVDKLELHAGGEMGGSCLQQADAIRHER